MASYSTLFTATDAELTQFFPGWRLPLAVPCEIKNRNPFTGKEVIVKVWDSDAQFAHEPTLRRQFNRQLIAPILPPDGKFRDYQQQLEENTPPLLRTFPHVAMKGFGAFELAQLGLMLIGEGVPPARFVNCHEDEGSIDALKIGAISILAEASDKKLKELAQVWVDVNKQEPGIDWTLLRLRLLAKDGVTRQANLFSHTLL